MSAAEVREIVNRQHPNRVRISLSPCEFQKSFNQLSRTPGGRQTCNGICLNRPASHLDARQPTFDTHHQLRGYERLSDVVIRAGGKDSTDTLVVSVTGEEDHRQIAPPAIVSDDAAQL